MDLSLLLRFAALLVALGLAWRVARWAWRPRLELGDSLEGTPGERWALEVRNRGRRAATACRAELVALDERRDGAWRRHPEVRAGVPIPWEASRPGAEAGSAAADLPAGATRWLEVAAPGPDGTLLLGASVPLTSGRYRVTLAVRDGDERRGVYELEA